MEPEVRRETAMVWKQKEESGSRWFRRFAYVALVNAAIALVWTVPVLFPELQISRQIAGGSAGTWGFVGYSLFLTIGFASMLGWAVLYYHIPRTLNARIFSNRLAAIHLILSEIGLLGATALLSVAGFLGGRLILAETPPNEIHEALIGYVEPIAYFVVILMVGVLLGIVNISLSLRRTEVRSVG